MSNDQFTVALWKDGAPGLEGKTLRENVKNGFITGTYQPQLHVYLPPAGKGDGLAIMVCPGGGYWGLAWDYEGEQVARWLTDQGIAALVLKYRVRSSDKDKDYAKHALADAQRALRLARASAKDWRIDPTRLGMMGFSAGGNLTVNAATHFDDGQADSPDPIERQGCRPDFIVPVYPAVYELDQAVTERTPAAFIVQGANDEMVPCTESTKLFEALVKHGVPAELHIFSSGAHGFGIGKPGTPVAQWPGLLNTWLAAKEYAKPTTKPASDPAKK